LRLLTSEIVIRLLSMLLLALALAPGAAAQPETLLLPGDPDVSDRFGSAVAISGEIAVVGAYGDDGATLNAGAAYVFRRTASGWAQETKLTAADALPGARFGDAVAAEGDRVFVGVPRDSAAFYGGGAVYVFARDAGTGTWVEEAKLLPSDLGTSYRFGVAVAVVGDLLAVGAPRATGAGFDTGAVYVFRRDATSGAWVEEAKLFSDTIGFDNVFGLDLALASGPAGEFVVANEAPKFDRFTAYVFARTGDPDGPNGGWVEEFDLGTLVPPGTFFGSGPAVSAAGPDVFALVGTDVEGVYAFHREGGSRGPMWVEEALLPLSIYASALDGAVALLGDPGDDDPGVAYVYERTADAGGVVWVERAQLTASDGAGNDGFGRAVALDGKTAVVGAPLADPMGLSGAGASYAYDLAPVLDAAEPAPPEEALVLRVFPNPAASSGPVTLAFRLPAPSAVRVSVYDVLGREIALVEEGTRAAGTHRVRVATAGLTAGVYVVRAVIAEEGSATTRTFTRRLTLLR